LVSLLPELHLDSWHYRHKDVPADFLAGNAANRISLRGEVFAFHDAAIAPTGGSQSSGYQNKIRGKSRSSRT